MKHLIVLIITFTSGFAYPQLLEDIPWSTPINISNRETESNYANFAVNKNGEIFVVWSEFDQPEVHETLSRIYLKRSIDGENWGDTEILTPLRRSDWVPQISVDTAGNPHIVWNEFNSGVICYKYWNDNGWRDIIKISDTTHVAWYPGIEIDKNNNIHIMWFMPSTGILYRYHNGNNWSDIDTVALGGAGINIKSDSEGNLHLVFLKRDVNSDYKVFYMKKEDNNWLDIEQVNFDTLDSNYPDFVIRSDNTPFIVWDQEVDTGFVPYEYKIYWSEKKNENWTKSTPVSKFSKARRPALTIDEKNIIHLVFDGNTWYSWAQTRDSIYYTFFNNGWNNNFVNLTENIGYIHSGGAKIKSNNNILYSIWQTLIEEPWNRDIFFTKKGVTIAIDNRYNEINFSLNQNYPNPFNPETIIKYSIPKRTNIKMLVYNILGKRIAELVNEEKTAGDYEITFNAEELNLTSGVYFYNLITGETNITRKMIYLK